MHVGMLALLREEGLGCIRPLSAFEFTLQIKLSFLPWREVNERPETSSTGVIIELSPMDRNISCDEEVLLSLG